MDNKDLVRKSKFLSLILRHKPETIGIAMDKNGYVNIKELLTKSNEHGVDLDMTQLEEIVEKNNKSRFSFDPEKSRIRAVQGHSINVDLDLKPAIPPDILYHGTAIQNIASIKEKGLHRGKRFFVHLSKDVESAKKVGMRYGKPIVLTIKAKEMYDKGYDLFMAENGVWLVDNVPQEFITF